MDVDTFLRTGGNKRNQLRGQPGVPVGNLNPAAFLIVPSKTEKKPLSTGHPKTKCQVETGD